MTAISKAAKRQLSDEKKTRYPKMQIGCREINGIPSIIISKQSKNVTVRDAVYVDDATGENARLAALIVKAPTLLTKANEAMATITKEERQMLGIKTLSAFKELLLVIEGIQSTETVLLQMVLNTKKPPY